MASTVSLPHGVAQQWRAFRRGPPGRRFLGSYERHQRSAKSGHWWGKLLCIGGGLVLFAIGAVFVLIPGPAILFFLLGGGLLARESPNVARALDWCELRTRAVLSWLRRRWRRMSWTARVVVATTGIVLAAAAAAAAYWFLFRR